MAESFFDKIYKNKTQHTPDVLSCLANLSNDEVFTPPDVVNQMLDLLPQDLFQNPNTTFLDPACKTGVFLREIAKRLLVGLEDKIPNLQERIDHIFHKQLYGIAITELTSLLSRRSPPIRRRRRVRRVGPTTTAPRPAYQRPAYQHPSRVISPRKVASPRKNARMSWTSSPMQRKAAARSTRQSRTTRRASQRWSALAPPTTGSSPSTTRSCLRALMRRTTRPLKAGPASWTSSWICPSALCGQNTERTYLCTNQ